MKYSVFVELKKLFSENGYTAVTMTAIKKVTGLSIGGVSKYFKSTKDIDIAIFAHFRKRGRKGKKEQKMVKNEKTLEKQKDIMYNLQV